MALSVSSWGSSRVLLIVQLRSLPKITRKHQEATCESNDGQARLFGFHGQSFLSRQSHRPETVLWTAIPGEAHHLVKRTRRPGHQAEPR
jgi:hypothetical protein